MTPQDWLEKNVPSFNDLDEIERNEIYAFTMLWSFFENRYLGKSAGPKVIEDFVKQRLDEHSLQVAQLEPHFAYFQNRYMTNSGETEHFAALHLRENESPKRVRGALNGSLANDLDRLYALFIIVYRLRNNFFHGEKWTYGLRGQKSNFEHANQVLIIALS